MNFCRCQKPKKNRIQSSPFLMMSARFGILLVIVFVVSSTTALAARGCQEPNDSSPDVSEATGALTPGDAGLEYFFCLLAGDAEPAKKVCTNTDTFWSVCESTANFVGSAAQFRRRFIEQYGRSAWNAFNDENHTPRRVNGGAANGSLTVMELDEFTWIYRELNENQSEDESSCRYPNTETELVVIKKEGRWYVDLEKSTPMEVEQIESILTAFRGISTGVRQLTPAIGREGVSPNQIDYELGRISLRALGKGEFPPQPDFTLDELPRLVDGPTEKSKNVAKSARGFLDALLTSGDSSGYQHLHSEVQRVTDPAVFSQQIKTLRSVLDGVDPSEINFDFVEPITNRDSWHIIAKLNNQERAGMLNLYLFENKLVGVQVQFGNYALDTRFASRNMEKVIETAKTLLTAVFKHDIDKVASFYQDDPNFRESFESNFETLLSKQFSEIVALPSVVKIQWPPTEKGLTLTCRQLIQYEVDDSDKLVRLPCDTTSLLSNEAQNPLGNFTLGDNNDEFYSNDAEKLASTLKAFCSGDSKQVLALMHSDEAEGVEKPTLQAYVSNFRKNFGEFDSVDMRDFNCRTVIADLTEETFSRGNIKMSKREMFVEIVHVDGWLDGFSFYKAYDDGWQRDIADLEPFVARGKQVCDEYFNGDLRKFAGLCSDDINRQILDDIEKWTATVEEIREDNGKFFSVLVGETEYLPEQDRWRCHYQIDFEKGHFKAYVDIDSAPFRSSIEYFNYNWFENGS